MKHKRTSKQSILTGTKVATSIGLAVSCAVWGAAPSSASTKHSSAAHETLTVWQSYTGGEEGTLFNEYANKFQKENPGVTVKVAVLSDDGIKEKVATAIVAHDLPDVVQWWGGAFQLPEVTSGAFLKLNSMIAANKSWASHFLPGSFDNYTYKGGIYQVPMDDNVVLMFYNKKLLASAGISKPPTTWSQLLTDVKALKSKGITPLALDGKDGWPFQEWYTYLVMRYGGAPLLGQALAGRASWTNPAWLKAADSLETLIKTGAFETGWLGTGQPAWSLYEDGHAAMMLSGNWLVDGLLTPSTKAVLHETSFVNFPTVPGGKGGTDQAQGGANDSLAVSSRAADPNLAEKFVRFMSSASAGSFESQNVVKALDIPPLKVSYDHAAVPALFNQTFAAMGTYKAWNLFWNEVIPPTQNTEETNLLESMAVGSITPAKMVSTFATYMKVHPAQ